ncbi:MAG: hypothetical protein ACRC04_07105 [Aeromonas veronii]
MAHIVDKTKTPLQMLLSQINADNNFSLTEADVKLRALTALEVTVPKEVVLESGPVTIQLDTTIEIDLLTDEVVDDFVKFTYRRVDLANYFSLIEPEIRSIDVELDEHGVPVDQDALFAEILRKYKIAGTPADFDITVPEAGKLRVAAKASNIAYTKQFDIVVLDSLTGRVLVKLLDGFWKPEVAPEAPTNVNAVVA